MYIAKQRCASYAAEQDSRVDFTPRRSNPHEYLVDGFSHSCQTSFFAC